MGNVRKIQKGSQVRILAAPYHGEITGKILQVDISSSFPYTVELENGWTVPYHFSEVAPIIELRELSS
ncbi:hypothetical protein RAC89_23765 [Paenibacillus sp. GD4]|uniref:hypothetical protein n=1 Tax=Paenibacillus sp. GD4 TaxID=3068890 RepID=UPI0027964384|nr:hypothetical protein [Paenibacillus sp. GD4]MDQ1913419.1 hypothetical protein [Paenibacillus sp. GD4]